MSYKYKLLLIYTYSVYSKSMSYTQCNIVMLLSMLMLSC